MPPRLPHHQLLQRQASEGRRRQRLHSGGGTSASGRLNAYKDMVRNLLTSEDGLMHRSRRPIEPEAVFGHIKANGMFKRFRLKGLSGINIEFGLKAIAHNLKKMSATMDFSLLFEKFGTYLRFICCFLQPESHFRNLRENLARKLFLKLISYEKETA